MHRDDALGVQPDIGYGIRAMPNGPERPDGRLLLGLLFDFGEITVLRSLAKPIREKLIADRIKKSDEEIARATRNFHGVLSADAETQNGHQSRPHRKGEPDWDEVHRDAVKEVAHRMFGGED